MVDFYSAMDALVDLDYWIDKAATVELHDSFVNEFLDVVRKAHLLDPGFNVPDPEAARGISVSPAMSEEESLCVALNGKYIERDKLLLNPLLTTDAIMMRLARDGNVSMRKQVFYRSKGFSGLVVFCFDPSEVIRINVASLPSTCSNLLRVLSCDSDKNVQAAVVRHKNAPADVLARLAEEGADGLVRENARRALISRR